MGVAVSNPLAVSTLAATPPPPPPPHVTAAPAKFLAPAVLYFSSGC